MQYIVSRNRVLNYIAKYAAKSEPRSKGLKVVYGNILKTMKDNGSSLKMVQLSAWRANVDMQYIVSRNRVLNYIAKYAAKSEPRSKGLKVVYGNILKTMKDNGSSLKMVQKLMISSVGERDYSAQETCHLLLGLPMYWASRDFVYLTLDGSRQIDSNQEEGTALTVGPLHQPHHGHRDGRIVPPGVCSEV